VADAGRHHDDLPGSDEDPPAAHAEPHPAAHHLEALLLLGVDVKARRHPPARGDFEVDHHQLTAGLRRGLVKRDPLARQRVLDHLPCICQLSSFLAASDTRLSRRLLETRTGRG
jgi:hypothetical protein